MKKNIIVENNRPIMALGRLRGPVGPSSIDVKTIFNLLTEGCKVIEVLKNGERVELDYNNFDVDLNKDLVVEVEPEENVEKVQIPTHQPKPENIHFKKTKNQNKHNFKKGNNKGVKPVPVIDVCEDV